MPIQAPTPVAVNPEVHQLNLCSKLSRGPTEMVGMIPRGRDRTPQEGTASYGLVQGKAPRGLLLQVGTVGPYTLGLSKYSETYVAV